MVLGRADPVGLTFQLCFFSCQSHFRFLYCSLHSLKKQVQHTNFKVQIFSDAEQPLSDAQIAAIQALIPGTLVTVWPRSVGWGATQIGNIWRAYGIAAAELKDSDFIVKIDSDVFFFNDLIFRVAARSDADLIGDGHYVDFKYSQGGCYFFKVGAVRNINASIEKLGMEQMLQGIDVAAEDAAATHFAKTLGLKVWLTWFMMFPDELKNAGGLTAWYRWKFSCLHFVMKNKVAMLEAYEQEVLGGATPIPYKNAMTIQ